MGSFLNQFFGGNYRNIGFVFNKGSFQAIEAEQPHKLKKFSVPQYKNNSLTNAMVLPGIKDYFIDLRSSENPVFTTDQAAYSIGAWFINVKVSSEKMNAGKLFDGLIFINETSRAQPIIRKAVN